MEEHGAVILTAGASIAVLALWTAWLTARAKAIIRREKAKTFGFMIGAIATSSARTNSLDAVIDLATEISRIHGSVPRDQLARVIAAAALLQSLRFDMSEGLEPTLSDIGGEGVRGLARAASGVNAAAQRAAKDAVRAIEEKLSGREPGPDVASFSPGELIEGALILEKVATSYYSRAISVKFFDRDDVEDTKADSVAAAVVGTLNSAASG